MEDVSLHVGVESRYWVVHQDDVLVRVDSSSKGDPGLLPAAQVDSFLANLSLISSRQYLQVSGQFADLDDLVVLLPIKRLEE